MGLWVCRLALNYSLCSAHYIVILHCNVLLESFLLAPHSVTAENCQAFNTSTCNKRQHAKTFACVFKCVFWSMFFEGKHCLIVSTGQSQIKDPVCTCNPFFFHCQHCQLMTLDIFFKAQCPGSKWLYDKMIKKSLTNSNKPTQNAGFSLPACRECFELRHQGF